MVKPKPATQRSLKRGFPWKWVISGAIFFHLWAVVAEPLRFQTRGPLGPSPATNLAYLPVGFYAEFMYLTHGYAFFAPDPGPSHLFKAKLVRTDGSVSERLYPNLALDRPRLMYHRHFMLAEFLNNTYRPEPVTGTPSEKQALARERNLYLQVATAFRTHLAEGGDPANVELLRLEHRLPWIDEVQAGLKLDDPGLYRELKELDLKTPLLESPGYFDRAWPKQ
jgi:hypothetical protein